MLFLVHHIFQAFHQCHKRHPFSCCFVAIFHCEVSGKVCRWRILSNEGLLASGEILQAMVIPSAPFLFTQDEYIEIRKMWKSCLDPQGWSDSFFVFSVTGYSRNESTGIFLAYVLDRCVVEKEKNG